MNKKFIVFLATFGYAGQIPLLGGTIGSLAGLLISLIFNNNQALKGLVLLFFIMVGTYVTTVAEKISGKKDDRRMVIDEVSGALVSTFFLPEELWLWMVALVSFRFFDWSKPFPIRRLEKLAGGMGVMADDLVAGLYGLGLTWGIYLLWR